MKSFQQYLADTSQVEEMLENDILELARDTEYHIRRDLEGSNMKAKPQPKKRTVIQVRDKQGGAIRSYNDLKRFKANMSMHKSAGHTFHRVIE